MPRVNWRAIFFCIAQMIIGVLIVLGMFASILIAGNMFGQLACIIVGNVVLVLCVCVVINTVNKA